MFIYTATMGRVSLLLLHLLLLRLLLLLPPASAFALAPIPALAPTLAPDSLIQKKVLNGGDVFREFPAKNKGVFKCRRGVVCFLGFPLLIKPTYGRRCYRHS